MFARALSATRYQGSAGSSENTPLCSPEDNLVAATPASSRPPAPHPAWRRIEPSERTQSVQCRREVRAVHGLGSRTLLPTMRLGEWNGCWPPPSPSGPALGAAIARRGRVASSLLPPPPGRR